jgi:hypothetical protein
MLSLMHYCEVGKKYWKYFYGVHPLMETEDNESGSSAGAMPSSTR